MGLSLACVIGGYVSFGADPLDSELCNALRSGLEQAARVEHWTETQGESFRFFCARLVPGETPKSQTLVRTASQSTVGDISFWSNARALPRIELDGAVLSSLDADFALANWCADTSKLTLARDVFGIRPLYWMHRVGEWAAFSSIASAFIDAGLSENKVDERTISKAAVFDFNTGADTFVDDVKRVPQASIVRISSDDVDIRRYYDHMRKRRSWVGSKSNGELLEELQAKLEKAVSKRLPSRGNVGAHLSGGLDSSSLCAVTAESLKQPERRLETFFVEGAARPNLTIANGRPFVSSLSQRHSNISVNYINAPHRGFGLSQIQRSDMPVPSSMSNDEWVQSFGAIASKGIDRMISGYGGDQTISGKGKGALRRAFFSFQWSYLWRELRAMNRDKTALSLLGPLLNELAAVLTVPWLHNQLRKLAGASELPEYRRLKFLSKKGLQNYRQRSFGSLRRSQITAVNSGTLSFNAEILSAHAAQYGVFVVYPFLDKELVEFVRALPDRFFLSNGIRRWAIRQIMEDKLPGMIVDRQTTIPTEPDVILALSEAKNEILAMLASLQNSGTTDLFDCHEMMNAVEALPDEDTERDLIETLAVDDRAPDTRRGTVMLPITLAKFCAERTTRN